MKFTRESVSTSTGKREIMVGRKRKQVKRQPNGQPSRERGIDPNAVAQLMPHRRLVPAKDAHDPKAESFLGRLSLNGWVTEAEYDAGVKYREIVARYRILIDAPQGEVSLSGVVVGPWGGSSFGIDDEEARRRKAAYDAAFEHVDQNAGHRAAVALSRCINERPGVIVPDLICGLWHLCKHFGLTNTRNSANAINRR